MIAMSIPSQPLTYDNILEIVEEKIEERDLKRDSNLKQTRISTYSDNSLARRIKKAKFYIMLGLFCLYIFFGMALKLYDKLAENESFSNFVNMLKNKSNDSVT